MAIVVGLSSDDLSNSPELLSSYELGQQTGTRRHLSKGQRAMIAAQSRAISDKLYPSDNRPTQQQVADEMGVPQPRIAAEAMRSASISRAVT